MEHFFIICQQLCSFNANSDLVLSDGCNVYKMRNVFFITSPYLPFLFPLHITGKYKPSKKSSTKFYKILQWIFVKLILISQEFTNYHDNKRSNKIYHLHVFHRLVKSESLFNMAAQLHTLKKYSLSIIKKSASQCNL